MRSCETKASLENDLDGSNHWVDLNQNVNLSSGDLISKTENSTKNEGK
jgi:hypothetical protein